MTARWTGFTGAPGYSNFYFGSGFLDGGLLGDEAQALADRVGDAFNALSDIIPPQVDIRVEPEVPLIDSATGTALDFNTIEPPDYDSGPGVQDYAGPSGAVVTWRTGDLRNGRRIRGRTFLVPLASQAYESDGTLTNATMSAIRNFGDTMIGGSLEGDLGVWSRPVNGEGGVFASVTGFTVPDLVAVLRSRRD